MGEGMYGTLAFSGAFSFFGLAYPIGFFFPRSLRGGGFVSFDLIATCLLALLK